MKVTFFRKEYVPVKLLNRFIFHLEFQIGINKMQRLLTQTTKSLLNSVSLAKKLTGNRSKLTFPVFKLLLFQLYFFIAPLATAVADTRIEVFVDGKPVLVPPGSTVLQVYIYMDLIGATLILR